MTPARKNQSTFATEELSAFLRHLAERGITEDERDQRRLIFADWLDEHYPATKVAKREHLPRWLKRAWLRAERDGRLHPEQPHRRPRRQPAAPWSVLHRMADHCGGWWQMKHDHAGTTEIAGVRAFVSEPYIAGPEAAAPVWRWLADLTGSIFAFGRESFHGRGTLRLLLCPHPDTDAWPEGG